MRLLFGLLSAAANAAVVAGLALLVVPAARGLRDRVLDVVDRREDQLALVVAAVATLGSLYLSEVAHLEPCRLCWYQRIAMYPLVVILLVAVIRRESGVPYVLPTASIGLAISAYHYALQQFPSLDAGACGSGVSCVSPYFKQFGFMSIPYMAGSAFALIVMLMVGSLINARRADRASGGGIESKENR